MNRCPVGPTSGPGWCCLGGSEEAVATRLGPTERLTEHLTRGQLSRLDDHVSGIHRDAVPTAGAATLTGLRAIVRLRVGEGHRPFAHHEPHGQCSKFHWSPFSLETCPATLIY